MLPDDHHPICADHAVIEDARYDDIDAQAVRLSGHGQTYQQIGPGRFEGRFITADLGEQCWLFFEETNQALLQTGQTPADTISFMFLMGLDGRCRFEALDFDAGDLAVLSPGSRFSIVCPPDTIFCGISLPAALLAIEPDVVPGLLGAYRLRSPQQRLLTSALRMLVRMPLEHPDLADMGNVAPLQVAALRRSITSTLALALMSHSGRASGPPPHLFASARSLIQNGLREIDTISACRLLNVPRRTLETAFRAELGIGPSRYIKVLRLNAVRREILAADCATPVADIAARWGFWHPSHFAQGYAQLFGELPSAAKQRIRVA